MTERPPRVLIVDDEGVVRNLLSRAFGEHGFAVEVARTGEDALARCLAEHAPDLLVTDLSMPGLSGMELATAVREGAPGVALLAVSGYEELLERARAAGIRTVRKPCSMKDVVAQGLQLLPAARRPSERKASVHPRPDAIPDEDA